MVTVIDKTVKVTKECDEVMTGLANIVRSSKQALADGWQTGKDLPVIATSAMTNLLPAVDGMDKIPEEWQAQRNAMLNAILLGASDLVDILMPPSKVVDGNGDPA